MKIDNPICNDCGKPITRRMKANVWQEETILCTQCFHARRSAIVRACYLAKLIGIAHSPWKVHDGEREHGPFATQEVIDRLENNAILLLAPCPPAPAIVGAVMKVTPLWYEPPSPGRGLRLGHRKAQPKQCPLWRKRAVLRRVARMI